MQKNNSGNGFHLPKKIGIIYSEAKRRWFASKEQYLTEKEALIQAKIVAKYIKKMGIKPFLYPGNAALAQKLQHRKPGVVLNLVGSVKGNEYMAATIPALLELLDIPYTGADMLGESLAYNKFLIKKLLQQNGVPVPHYQLFQNANDFLDPTLRFPLIAKLNEIHGSVEINQDSVSENEKHLRLRLKHLIKTYDQPVLVEEFIVGREITAILFEGLNKKVYLGEKVFKNRRRKYILSTFEDQWLSKSSDIFNYRKYQDPLLKEYVKRAFEIVKMSSYGKFDVRVDSSGRYFFIDSNSNPDFGPKEWDCGIAYILDLYNISFSAVLKRLLLNTVREWAGKALLPLPEAANGQNH